MRRRFRVRNISMRAARYNANKQEIVTYWTKIILRKVRLLGEYLFKINIEDTKELDAESKYSDTYYCLNRN